MPKEYKGKQVSNKSTKEKIKVPKPINKKEIEEKIKEKGLK